MPAAPGSAGRRMKLTRETILNLLVCALLAGLAAWIVSRSEWVDVWTRTPAKAEALKDPYYASKQLLRRLGATVTAPDNLDRMPPHGATLVLISPQWDLFEERDEQLKRWVEAGGHLVLPDFTRFGDEITWVPIREVREKVSDDPKPSRPPNSAEFKPNFVGPRMASLDACPVAVESAAHPGAYGAPRTFRLCNASPYVSLQSKQAALWSIDGTRGPHVLRIGLGTGSVTAIGPYGLLGNHSLFHGDHALAVVAALHAAPGSDIWFVVDEAREALLLWLWHRAGPAIALGLSALALALWRGAIRFGPMAARPTLARRSVAEQIRGSAAFILRRGGGPLLDAARRALDESARQRLPGLDRMGLEQRAAAIAKATGVSDQALQRALDSRLAATRRELPDRLALLETARRRLDTGILFH